MLCLRHSALSQHSPKVQSRSTASPYPTLNPRPKHTALVFCISYPSWKQCSQALREAAARPVGSPAPAPTSHMAPVSASSGQLGINSTTPESSSLLPQVQYQGAARVPPAAATDVSPAFCRSGALADMQQHGVECIDCFAVDNALIKPASPLFIGYCHSQGSDCGVFTCLS